MAKPVQKEIKEIVRIIQGISRASEENDPDLDKQMDVIQEVFTLFNKKYPKLFIKTESRITGIIVRIFINEASVKKAFDDVASKMKGLTGIGLKSFDESTIQQQEKFVAVVNGIKDKVFLTFSSEAGSDTLVLEFDNKLNKIELNYDIKSLGSTFSPEYQLLEQYASKESDKSVNLLDKCYQLGFIDIEDDAVFEWEDEFYPKMLE